MKKISKDTPLSEITLRRYERPNSESKRDIVRKICLSIGLLQPGDSRDIVVDILFVMLNAKKQKKGLSSDEIQERVVNARKRHRLALNGVAASNVRRQLRRLKELFIIEKQGSQYRITEFMELKDIYRDKIEGFLVPSITSRISEYFDAADEKFGKKAKGK